MTPRRRATYALTPLLAVALAALAVPASAHHHRAPAVPPAATPPASAADARPDGGYDPLVRVHLARYYADAGVLSVSNADGVQVTLRQPGRAPLEATLGAGALVTVAGGGHGDVTSNDLGLLGARALRLPPGATLCLVPRAGDDDDTAGAATFAIRHGLALPHRYRGAIQIAANGDGTLAATDVLPLDEYLQGVVGPEIGGSAPLEALKAQAVAARTYTIKNLGKCAGEPGSADLDDTTHCESYEGFDAESWRCRTAVQETSGKVLTYDGALIDAVYMTDCGGETAVGDAPYLRPVPDAACASAPAWSLTLPLAALDAALRRAGVRDLPRRIDTVAVVDRDESGRATTLSFGGAAGDESGGGGDADSQGDADGDGRTGASAAGGALVSGTLLRRALGYDRLRSTLFEVSVDSDGRDCLFTGHGWGHGLGMCQDGAVEMARSGGASYERILCHYYTGVELTDLSSDFIADDDGSRDNTPANLAAVPASPADELAASPGGVAARPRRVARRDAARAASAAPGS